MLHHAGRAEEAGPEEVAALVRDAADGSAAALKALEQVGQWLGLGLAGLVNVFDPQIVVLGGHFAETSPFTLDALRRQLDDRKLAITREPVEVVISPLGVNAPVLGAAERAFEPLLADPASSPVGVVHRGPQPVQTGAAM
jgi:predicted NBD/HSP70 family sugar kinase